MELFTILVIAVILALDCFAVAIAAGSSRVSDKGRLALLLAIPFGFFQFAMTIAGWAAGARTVSFISGFDHWAAFCILAVIGGKMVYEGYRNDVERVPVYNAPTIIMLSLATSIDALGAGLSLAFLGGHIGTSSVIIGLTSFVFAFAGVLLGRRLGEHLGKSMEIIGGIVLLVIGLRILVESIV
ncbi:MAG TPA: manganese efflux pump MntP family protein [Methanoregulaceae archaeon]|nr:manganese efflux pump MntP family protein [Methanoregulaceae archaeon]MDD5685609.1 manganese efflux pump MntP family protein [Methanoregulaceae archaeon]HOP67288.1 manganese efflux pump MntP family protein [Methanoregulaceae archaeon]HPJ74575.1 manganese efflux pump MntP family protein [Methanoregulaceae archaeon]HPQ76327.1 manganese efflux pump MntP family protein [Methanoregulaceae archaeon]